MKNETSSGILYVVSTPIGNLEDITLRALRVLKEVDLVAAEDTRRTRQLLTHYGIQKPLISYHEHNQRMREDRLLEKLREGKNVALVTDAGTPGISDPGEPLIRRAIREKIPLVPVPGPAAAMAALSISGLPTDRFLFYGFLPAKSSARKKVLEGLRKRPETLVFYESPRRLPALLTDETRADDGCQHQRHSRQQQHHPCRGNQHPAPHRRPDRSPVCAHAVILA